MANVRTTDRTPEIVVTGQIFPPGTDLLREVGRVRQLNHPSAEEIHEAVCRADAAIMRIHPLSGDTIEAAKRLKVIGRFGVGIDNIDLEAATRRGIPVVYTPGVNARAVAEHALSLAFCLLKRLRFWNRELLAGRWDTRWTDHSDDIVGKTLGVVGLGNVGRHLARLAAAVQFRVIGCDPMLTPRAAGQFGVELLSLEETFRQADVLSLHVPLTADTHRLVNGDRLAWMKDGSYVVNTARGGLLDLDAVYQALVAGKLAGVGLDVYPTEPPDVSHPLFHHPGFVGSPHCASHTQTTLDEIGRIVAREVAAVLRNERPLFVANPEVFAETAQTEYPQG